MRERHSCFSNRMKGFKGTIDHCAMGIEPMHRQLEQCKFCAGGGWGGGGGRAFDRGF